MSRQTFFLTFALLFTASASQASDPVMSVPASPTESVGCTAGSEALPILMPEPEAQSSLCISPGSYVTCSASECHTNCQADSTCSPTGTVEYFRIYRNSSSWVQCCTNNGYIGSYPQCQGGVQWWMSFSHYYKQCNCV